MPKKLIYLEDAIKALDTLFAKQIKQFDYDSYEKADEKTQLMCDGISESIGCLLDLPSAQPEQPTGVQDILQYLDEYLHPIVSPEHWSVYSELYDMVSMLPSAQPEIIRCNTCRHWHQTVGKMEGFGLGNCDYLEKKLVTCNGYCYWAERKEDE